MAPTPAPLEQTQNAAPVIRGSPDTTVSVDSTWQFIPIATDADGDGLLFSVTGLPSWADFEPNTGRAWGTPTADDAGTSAAILISVSDGESVASLPAFTLTVVSVASRPPPPQNNTRPTIAGAPQLSVQANSTYTFTPSASDAETPLSLVFAITNRPSWASFSTATGKLSGTPTAAQVGTYANIVISVTDGSLTAALPAYTISVTGAANQAPTISGSPAMTATVGQTYTFQPRATDPEGRPLVYSITNKPSWASFTITNGRLSGTPGATDVGTFADITITATDPSQASVSLPSFSITVTDVGPSTGSAQLSWTAPTENADGTILTDLAGFFVYRGSSDNLLNDKVELLGADTNSFEFTGLASGTHFFAVSAFNSVGVEGALSSVSSKLIP